MKKVRKKAEKSETKQITRVYVIPLVIAIAVVPLIVMTHVYNTNLETYSWFGPKPKDVDFFLFWKSVFIVLSGLAALVIMAMSVVKKTFPLTLKKRNLTPVIAIGVLLFMTIISSVLSDHKVDAFLGGHVRFEGCLVYVAYGIIFLMAFFFTGTEKITHFLLSGLMIGAFILTLIGAFQAVGSDIYNVGWIQALTTLGSSGLVDSYTNSMGTMAYSTLYNPNYVGSYVPLILPFCIFMVVRGNKTWVRILSGVTVALSLVMLKGSMSDAGKVALAAGIIVVLILIFPFMKKIVRIVTVAVAGIAIVGIAYVFIHGGITDSLLREEPVERAIDNMRTDGNKIILTLQDGKKIDVSLSADVLATPGWNEEYAISDMLTITDEGNGEKLNTIINQTGSVSIQQEGYPELKFRSDSGELNDVLFDQFHIMDGEHDWCFLDDGGNNLKYVDSASGMICKLRDIERSDIFKGHYSMASGRGYIWACTIPLLKKYLFTGAGPNNYIYAFPNDDYVYKKYDLYGENTYYSYPHNMYLLIWVDHGLIALLAFIFLYGLLMIRTLRYCYRRRKKDDSGEYDVDNARFFTGILIAAAVGTSAYMVAGLANDTIVCVAPVFWVLLGVGYAAEAVLNRQLTKEVIS